ncbi:MAG: hypothetical protein IPP01_01925 [Saprospiraceae bacterium]|nr:hypothetical protein [Saprospiraceae bacterium]
MQKENKHDALFAIAQDGLEILFAVQFKDFMPHGLFNRLACFFGGLQGQKYYVKNKMIFTLNSVKVWLEIDPIQMRVIVKSANYKNSITEQLKAYLFRIIITAYWNEPLISFKLYQHILHLFKNISFYHRDTVKEVLLNNNNDAYQELRDSVIKGINDDYLNEFQELQKKIPCNERCLAILFKSCSDSS